MKNSKKIALSIIVCAVFLSPLMQVNAGFPDIIHGNPFEDAINYVQEEGIVKGFSDGEYKPYRSITRAEFTKILINTKYGSEVEGCKDTFFPDVPANHQFLNYICVAKKNNVVNGFSDGEYKPNWPITRAEASKIIVNGYGFNTDQSTASQYQFKPWVDVLLEKKALPSKASALESELKRDEMAEIIYRLENNITDKESFTFDNAVTYRLFLGKVNSITGDMVSFKNNECPNSGDCDTYDPAYTTFHNADLEFSVARNIIVMKNGSNGLVVSNFGEFKSTYGSTNYVFYVEDSKITKIQPYF